MRSIIDISQISCNINPNNPAPRDCILMMLLSWRLLWNNRIPMMFTSRCSDFRDWIWMRRILLRDCWLSRDCGISWRIIPMLMLCSINISSKLLRFSRVLIRISFRLIWVLSIGILMISLKSRCYWEVSWGQYKNRRMWSLYRLHKLFRAEELRL